MSISSSGIRLGLLRKRRDALSEGVSLSKSNLNTAGEGVVVIGGGGRVGQGFDLIVVSSIDSDSTSSISGSYKMLISIHETDSFKYLTWLLRRYFCKLTIN